MRSLLATSSPWLRTHRRRWGAALLLALGGVGAMIQSSTIARIDDALSEAAHAATHQPLVQLSFHISDLASTHTAFLITAVAAVALAVMHHWRGAVALAVAVLATQAGVQLVKVLVARPRPEDSQAVVDAHGFSFPSAHSATAMALYASLAVVAASLVRGRTRVGIVAAAGLVVMAVGATRVYLGAHYPTDVLAGWLTGALIVLASWALVSRLPLPAGRRRGPVPA